MKIANPLYDHAFKYLMSNHRLARKVLSVILDREVLDVALAQQEVVVEDRERQFTLYRLDCKARIRTDDGRTETVLVELQKSKMPTDLLRFRSYLGAAYSHRSRPDATPVVREPDSPYPIISIYIMGYNLQDIPVMAVKVDRRITDIARQEEIVLQSDFIDLLTHTCYILQVRRLPALRRTRIEQFMTLFNQAWVQEEKFILDLEEVPDEFRDIAEYLRQPLLEEDMRRQLWAEQELEDLFASQEAEVKYLREQAAAAQAEAAAAHKAADIARNQRQQAIQMMLRAGISREDIAAALGIEPEEVG